MLGFGPWERVDQPGAGGVDGKIRRSSFGDRLEINQPVLDGERYGIGTVAAGNREHLAGFSYPQASAVGGVSGAARALDQLITIAAAERSDLRADVGDPQHRRQQFGTAYKRASPPPPFDQVSLRQLR